MPVGRQGCVGVDVLFECLEVVSHSNNDECCAGMRSNGSHRNSMRLVAVMRTQTLDLVSGDNETVRPGEAVVPVIRNKLDSHSADYGTVADKHSSLVSRLPPTSEPVVGALHPRESSSFPQFNVCSTRLGMCVASLADHSGDGRSARQFIASPAGLSEYIR